MAARKWGFAASVLVAVCLMVTQLDLAAFAQNTPNPPNQGAAQTATPPAPTGRSVKKWLFIGLGAAAAVVTAIFVTRDKSQPEVTVGAPTVGNPQ